MTRCQRYFLDLIFNLVERVATIYASTAATCLSLYLTCSVSYSVMICSHPRLLSVFTALPDRPLQWTTTSTPAPDATSWRFPRRMTTSTSTSTSRILSLGSDVPVGGYLCVALSRVIWILTVPGPYYASA